MVDGDLHVALEDLAVQAVARVAADEEGAEGPEQIVERPDARPFADREAERDTLGGEEGDQHVVHVAAVIDDEDDAGVGGNIPERGFVDVADPDAEECRGDRAGEPVGEPMVQSRAVLRDDLFGVGPDARQRPLRRDSPLGGVPLFVGDT